MSEINAHGLAMEIPPGWEGRIFRRQQAGEARAAEVPGKPAPAGEATLPLAHLATVPLPVDAADYGSDVVGTLGTGDVFMVLKEFSAAEAGQSLFARPGLPRALDPEAFDPNTLQRSLAGQAGQQIFFNEGGRAFCLYVVIGDWRRRHEVVPAINAALANLTIEPSPEAPAPEEPVPPAPAPEQPAPDQPAPEQQVPAQPAPEEPAP